MDWKYFYIIYILLMFIQLQFFLNKKHYFADYTIDYPLFFF